MDDGQHQEQAQQQSGPEDELAFPDLKRGEAWGESITKRHADELEAMLQKWEQEKEHGERSGRSGPFDRVTLAGAEVGWLSLWRIGSGRSQRRAVVAGASPASRRLAFP